MKRIPPAALAASAFATQLLMTRKRRATKTSRSAAVVLATASAGVAVSAVATFRRHRTTVDPMDVDKAATLVTDGMFRRTRNPMYVGIAGGLLAHALYRRSWAATLPVVAFVAAIDRLQIPAEERALRARFGPEYESYTREVPRWVGR